MKINSSKKTLRSFDIYINGRFLSQPITGVQKFCHQQLLKLSKTHDVTVLLPKNADSSLLPECVKYLYVGSLTGHFWEQIELPLFLYRKKNASLMSFSGLSPVLYKNSIFTIHDLSFVKNPKWFSLPYRIWYGFAYSLLSRTCNRVITVSNFSKSEILKKYPRLKGRIDVVYNISPEIDEKECVNYNSQYGEYILLVSSLDPRKNIKSFIEAFNMSKMQGYNLVVVGGSGKAFKIDYPSLDFPNIHFLGYVDDEKLISLYKKAHLFAYPSLYEGFGIPPLEAMSMSCPCIVSNVASLPEVCSDAVLYFDPYSIESMTSAIKQGLEDISLRQILVVKGKARLAELKKIENQYSIERVINESTANE